MVRRSHTYVLALNELWSGEFESEPYEVSWAGEALIFVRTLWSEGLETAQARVQISPDGVHWCDEGSIVELVPAPGMTFQRVDRFGGWLRLAGTLPAGASVKAIAYVVAKE
ncbi:MAG: hypothetical protein IPM24_01515 [Bryobacterales bacterium]|nr:hypothetical protein [Bryobacterales bacterium]